ncbi:hypothetical protein XENOCAPTIV_014862 [Xenoophorus captivus]|uniref:Uncharacterized protein n=1 Tax=Xenoophorus captivus TaxID=1517983 RepID=A0ABV0S731_9TELE
MECSSTGHTVLSRSADVPCTALMAVQENQIQKTIIRVRLTINFLSALRVSMANPNSQIPGPFRQIRANNFLQDLSLFTPESRNHNLPVILCKDHIQSAIQLT